MIFYQAFILVFITASVSFFAPETVKDAGGKARIEMTQQHNMLQIKSYFLNEDSQSRELRYKLYTIRQGRSGISRNAQSGSFKVSPGEKELLSQTRISVTPDDNYAIKLLIFDQGELVSQDSLNFTGAKTRDTDL